MAIFNLVLVGYRATGKSTIGRLLAERLKFTYVDTDTEIEKRAGMTIAELIQEHGERFFRDLESTVVIHHCNQFGRVLACGGGAILRPGNVEAMKAHGKVVWLTAAVETICQRMSADPKTPTQRPPLTNLDAMQEIRQMLASRARKYREAADYVIKTDDRTPTEVADDILMHCRRSLLIGV